MNQRGANVDQGSWLSAAEASKTLGVKRETLYAYASRGLVRSAAKGGGDRARLYHKDDVDRLKARSLARSGHAAVAAGALRWGEPVLETRVGTIDDDGPRYRGKAALELAKAGMSFEEVCALLWEGVDAPKSSGERLGAPVGSLRALLRPNADPFDGMLVAAAAFAAAEPRGEPIEIARARAPALVRRLIAACALPRGADAVTASLEADGAARALLVALGGRTTKASIAAMEEALVLSADHELNASSFAARVAASAGASLAASTMAAFAALSGPLHGAATARVEAFVAEVDRPERATEIVAARIERGESVPGYGHPLYPGGDPRGTRLMEVARRVAPKARAVRILSSVTSAMALAARERPTIDVALVALAGALGLGRGAPLAIFASGRIGGLVAHAIEQREAGFMLRPRARYVGV